MNIERDETYLKKIIKLFNDTQLKRFSIAYGFALPNHFSTDDIINELTTREITEACFYVENLLKKDYKNVLFETIK